MHIEQKPILEVLGAPETRFVIPVFQRVYSWSTRQCDELWDDMRASRTRKPHFMGLLLCSRGVEGWHGLSQLEVIDGQQRLTTLTLLLVALSNHLDDADDLAKRFLVVESESHVASKLSLSSMDRATLGALVGADEPPEEPAQRLMDNCMLFAEKMQDAGFDARAFWAGLEQLEVALVMLEPDDSPQLVFESLNSKGMPLSTADRVRNLIIASTNGAEQERLYVGSWLPLERRVGSAQPPATVADVLHAWLAESYRSIRIRDASEVYGIFKTCLRDEHDGSLEGLLGAVASYCEKYLNDEDYRAEAQENADRWIAGKPKDLISEYKLFGD